LLDTFELRLQAPSSLPQCTGSCTGKQKTPLSAALGELHELLTGQLTLLSGLLLEQLQQMSKLVLSRLYTQQSGHKVCQATKCPLWLPVWVSKCTQGTGAPRASGHGVSG